MSKNIIGSFVWTLQNFHMYPHRPSESIDSPKFSIGAYEFCIELYPRGKEDPQYISAFLARSMDVGTPKVRVAFKMSVANAKHSDLSKSFEKQQTWGWNKCVERDQVLITRRSRFLPNNNLTIKVDVFSLSEIENNEVESETKNRKLADCQDTEILSRDFAELLKTGIHSDIVLVSGENEFKVHRAILECRCPELMTQMKMTEAANEYSLHDIKAPVLQTLLQYLYTGTLSPSKICEEILVASDRYDIPDLRHSLTFPHFKTVSATTSIVVSRLSLRWVITNFSKLYHNQELVYPALCATENEWSKLDIILTIIKGDNGSTDIQLKCTKWSSSQVAFIRLKVSISTKINEKASTIVKEYEHLFKGKSWVTPLGTDIELTQILCDDTLDMFFEISMSKDDITSRIEEESVETKTKSAGGEVLKTLKLLQKDLKNLYDAGHSKSANITLNVGDEKFRADKAVLHSRSPFFQKILINGSLGAEESITVEDIDNKTMSSTLRYIYYASVGDMDISKAINLYAAAVKFEILALRDKCANFLKTFMDADHIGEILLLAYTYHDESLSKKVYDYMAFNPNKILKSKDCFSVLKNRLDVYPDILQALLQRMPLKDSDPIQGSDLDAGTDSD